MHTDIDKLIISNETGATQGAGTLARELRGRVCKGPGSAWSCGLRTQFSQGWMGRRGQFLHPAGF